MLAQEDNRFYIAPMGTFVLADDDRHSDDGVGGTLALGLPLAKSVDVELRAAYLDYKADDNDDDGGLLGLGDDESENSDVTTGGFGTNVFLFGRRVPYLHFDVMVGDNTVFNYGLGYDLAIGKSFGLRFEALRHTESNSDDGGPEFHEVLFNVGVRIPFGRIPEPPPPPAPPPVEVVPVAPPPPICSNGLDDDGDGLVDFPADKGCESAEDGDEVDPPPKCRAPEPGQPVSLDGCAVGDTIVLRGVNFDFDKSTLTVNAKSILDGVAEALTSRPDVKVELGGHTDAKGSDEYNAKLSDRRAKSVVAYLAKKGIDKSRMTFKGYGESVPVASNDTDEGRELNRRVELKVTESAGGVTVAPVPSGAEPVPVPAEDSAEPPAAAIPGEPEPVAAAAASGSTVTIKDFAYAPAQLTIPIGTTVVWTNEDGSKHFVAFTDESSARMGKGETYSRTFGAPGIYPYVCTLHPTMTGTVVVQ
ncbi:MAG: OmpA family protein [Panacagrimonas sp.]